MAVAATRDIKHANDNRVATLAPRYSEVLSQKAAVKVDSKEGPPQETHSPKRLEVPILGRDLWVQVLNF